MGRNPCICKASASGIAVLDGLPSSEFKPYIIHTCAFFCDCSRTQIQPATNGRCGLVAKSWIFHRRQQSSRTPGWFSHCQVGDSQFLDHRPSLVRVILFHRGGRSRRLFAQAPLINDPVLVYNERHDPRGSPADGISDHRKAASHVATLDVIHLATRRARSLPRQDPEKIAVKWPRSFTAGPVVSFQSGLSNELR